jgi:hypothetical protein
MSTPKTATAFNEMMETPLLDQKFGVWWSQSWVIRPIFFEDTIISEH